MFCGNCGTKIEDGYKFCPKCGAKFAERTSISIETASNNAEVPSAQLKRKLQGIANANIEEEPYVSKYITDTDFLIKKAKGGDIPSLLRLAFRYENGLGVRQNEAKAEELYKEVENKGVSKDFVDLSFFTEIGILEHCNLEGVSIVPPVKYDNLYRTDAQAGGIYIKYFLDSWRKGISYEVEKYNKKAKSYGFSPIKLTYLGDRIYLIEGIFTPKKTSFWGEIFDSSTTDSIKEVNFQMKNAFNKICELCEKYRVITVSAEKEEDDEVVGKTITTFAYIADLLLEYADRIERNPDQKKSITAWLVSNILGLQNRFPQLLYTLCPPNMESKDAIAYVGNIKKKVYNCYYPLIPNYYANGFMDCINNTLIQTPNYFEVKYFSCFSRDCNKDKLNRFLLSILLSLPIKKVRLTIINLERYIDTRFWTAYINPKVYRIIATEDELDEFVDSLKREILKRKQKYEDFSEYCLRNKEIPEKYEVVILDFSTINFCRELRKMKVDCLKAGVYILDLGTNDRVEKLLYDKNIKYNSPKKDFLMRCTPLMENENLLHACIEYINEEADEKDTPLVISNGFNKVAGDAYEKESETIIIPVGKSEKEVNFRMDLVSHVHAFIIGQSGSGKSVFLHNIISNAILKYAPEDLQLYLLDFKLGGVEFNRYKDIKHVKALLVDNSDQQITLEILRELRERMVERGKRLRDAGASNLSEYNRMNKDATMPQILLIVDECHEMFRVGSDIPRAVSNEISEIVTKIAKEGRSQGVHLVLATQTLSGTEISNEILNNISDHYLFKCAPADSERIAERSSEITGSLQTGEVYYHHVERQLKFQAYYTGKKEAEELIRLAKEKSANHPSNNMFYFSGAQMFRLDESVLPKKVKYPTAYLGKSVSIHLNDVSITLRKDYSENILLFGINDGEQVTRTTFNLLLSLLMTTRKMEQPVQFKVINCLSNDESIYVKHLESLEERGFCEIVEGRKDRGIFLKGLAEDILNGKAGDMILFIFGQERFRELKMDMEIENKQATSKDNGDDAFGFGNFSFGSDNSSAQTCTFKQALETILDKGAELGVHVVMQLDKPFNFLFSDYVSPKFVYQKFKHLVMLKSEETASTVLNLNENVRLESLSRDAERLRAYYYSEESDTYTLFTPYMGLNEEEMLELLKIE